MDIDRLYGKAQAASPGPWKAVPGEMWDLDDEEFPQAGVDTTTGSLTWDDHSGEVFKPEDAEFIAEADPQAIMELIEYARRLREDVERLEKLAEDLTSKAAVANIELGASRMIIAKFVADHPEDVLSKVIISEGEES